MLYEEWDLDTALKVRWQDGFKAGLEEARVEAHKETARKALALGVSPATVAQAFGLDMETIKALATE